MKRLNRRKILIKKQKLLKERLQQEIEEADPEEKRTPIITITNKSE